MANPRQRRKSRSGTAKVKSSTRQQTKLRKVDPRGPEAFVKAWDKHQTPRQNWARLGIMGGKLDPKLSGGVERKMDKDEYWVNRAKRPDEFELSSAEGEEEEEEQDTSEGDEEDEDEVVEPLASTAPTVTSASLGKNQGRIIRDANGKVIKIILGDDNEDDASVAPAEIKGKARAAPVQTKSTPWGAPMEELQEVQGRNEVQMAANEGIKAQKPKPARQGIAYDATSREGPTSNALLNELQKMASETSGPVKRHSSKQETSWLRELVLAHGQDVSAMTRDLKRNVYQRTGGELRRAIRTAGGFEKLRSTAA